MSEPLITICPHCGKEVTVPYHDVKHHNTKVMGRLSAKKRKVSREYMRSIIKKRWEKKTPKE